MDNKLADWKSKIHPTMDRPAFTNMSAQWKNSAEIILLIGGGFLSKCS